MVNFFRNLQLNIKVSLLGIGSVLITAIALLSLAVWQSGQYNTLAQREVDALIEADLDHITQGVYNLVKTENEAVQQQVNSNLNVARHVLANTGSVSLSEETITWTATNQFTNVQKRIQLPRMLIGNKWLGQNINPDVYSAVVDEVTKLVGETATIFQRMNEQGDMIRVATTVKDGTGRRAIGTYIPAIEASGKPNPVMAAILKGKTYHGRAFVVNAWYLTAYEPIKDEAGRLLGMLYVGVKQKAVEMRVRQAILQTTVGKTGYVYVLGGKGEDRGRYIISQRGERDGENIWESKDSDGRYVVQAVIAKAITLHPGELTTERYRWQNPGEPAPRWKVARLAYYEPWDWVIGSSVYEDELLKYQAVLSGGRTRMTTIMSIAGLTITLLIGLAGIFIAWTIARPVSQLTDAAETIIKGDLNHVVDIHSHDEIGALAQTFNIMTARLRQTMEGLQDTQRKLSDIIDFFPDATLVVDKEGKVIAWNRAIETMTGVRAEEMLGKGNYEYALPFYGDRRPILVDLALHPDPETENHYTTIQRSQGNILFGEAFTPSLPGGVAHLSATASVLRDSTGEIIAAIECIRDNTHRKEVEAALRNSERQMKAIVGGSPIPQFVIDKNHRVIHWNRALDEYSGIRADDVIGTNQQWRAFYESERPCLADLIVDGSADLISQWYAGKYSQSRLIENAFEATDFFPAMKGGTWLYFTAAPIYGDETNIIGAVETLVDITERKRSEEMLILNYERSVAMLKLNQMAGNPLQEIMNFSFEEAVRLTKSKIGFLGLMNDDQTVMSVQVWSHSVMPECNVANSSLDFPLDNAGLWAEVIRQRQPIIINDYDAPNPLKKGIPEGHIKITRHMSVPVFSGHRIVLVAGVGNKEREYDENDVQQLTLLMEGMWRLVERNHSEEERRKLENQLSQAQKMESIGTLAGGIAHDFNNILAGIIGYTELYKDAVRDRPKVYHSMEEVLRASDRAKDLVKQILTFSRKAEHEKKPVLLSPIVKEVIKFMRASLPATIEIIETIDVTSDAIMADPTQMHQVLMNLCTNAGYAMKDSGGILEISLKRVVVDTEDLLLLPLTSQHGHYLELTVRDSGAGIPENDLGRIFEPYFTTKGTGEGTGLGLAVVHGIIKDHGGEIRVLSEVGKGTIFRVYLPLMEKQEENRDDEEETLLLGKGETILFIDDEEMIVAISKEMLERLGYKVFAETDPVKAIDIFRKGPDTFDLVITDKTMPHMTGFDVVNVIKKIRANIPVLICSGYQEIGDMEKLTALGISHLIAKPIRIGSLAKAVRDALD